MQNSNTAKSRQKLMPFIYTFTILQNSNIKYLLAIVMNYNYKLYNLYYTGVYIMYLYCTILYTPIIV